MLSVLSFVVVYTVVHIVDNLHCVSTSHLAQESSTVTVILTTVMVHRHSWFTDAHSPGGVFCYFVISRGGTGQRASWVALEETSQTQNELDDTRNAESTALLGLAMHTRSLEEHLALTKFWRRPGRKKGQFETDLAAEKANDAGAEKSLASRGGSGCQQEQLVSDHEASLMARAES